MHSSGCHLVDESVEGTSIREMDDAEFSGGGFTEGGPSMKEIRSGAVIEQTVPFRVGVILALRP
jgi:hypothetical protein